MMNRRYFLRVTSAVVASTALASTVAGNSATPDLTAEVARFDALPLEDEGAWFRHWFATDANADKHPYRPTEDRVFKSGERIGDMTREEMLEQIAVAYYQVEWLSAALVMAARAAAKNGVSVDQLGVRYDVDFAVTTVEWAAKPIYVKEGMLRQETVEIDGISTRRSVEIDGNDNVLCVIADNKRMTEEEFAERIGACRVRYPDVSAERMVSHVA